MVCLVQNASKHCHNSTTKLPMSIYHYIHIRQVLLDVTVEQ